MTLVLTTYDWVPEFPRGYVRDLRIRWLLEEIGRPYQVDTVPLREKSAAHIARQPFAQVPMILDGDLSLFESGAILLYLAEGSALLPKGQDHPRTVQWLIAALNSVEPGALAWIVAKFFDKDDVTAARRESFLHERLAQLQEALKDRDWLVGGGFTVADQLMSDILRIPAESGLLDDLPQLAAYLERATDRPAFRKALADQMAHWQAADERHKDAPG